jgi:hypothetical protein
MVVRIRVREHYLKNDLKYKYTVYVHVYYVRTMVHVYHATFQVRTMVWYHVYWLPCILPKHTWFSVHMCALSCPFPIRKL